MDDGVPCEFYAIPAFVAVHGEVAADDGGDFGADFGGLVFDVGDEGGSAGGGGVSAIGDGVDEDVFYAGVCGVFGEGDELVLVGVDAAI